MSEISANQPSLIIGWESSLLSDMACVKCGGGVWGSVSTVLPCRSQEGKPRSNERREEERVKKKVEKKPHGDAAKPFRLPGDLTSNFDNVPDSRT